MKTLNILIVSNTAWDISNSFGNTFSSLFGGMDGIRIANIYCSYGKPDNETVSQSFQITEKMLLRNLADRRIPAGREISDTADVSGLSAAQKKTLSSIRLCRWRIFFWIREWIWFIGRWQSDDLYRFVSAFQPDLIFQPIYNSLYLMRINRVLQEKFHLPMAGFIGDDFYTWKYLSLSPFFWIDRFIKRKRILDTIRRCETLYVASEEMKREYDQLFRIDSRVLMKGNDFSGSAPVKGTVCHPLRFVYTGNLGVGRWKSLRAIGRVLLAFHDKGTAALLHIYSASPMSARMRKALTMKSIVLHGGIPGRMVSEVHKEADILVHAESLGRLDHAGIRLSFSTKIVDYCHAARAILAYGNRSIASMRYLEKNDAAVIASNRRELKEKIGAILASEDEIAGYAAKAWACGARNHMCENNTKTLYTELKRIAEIGDRSVVRRITLQNDR